jgi:hypothetical protein
VKIIKKCYENGQLYKEYYLKYHRVELEGNAGAWNISTMSEKEAKMEILELQDYLRKFLAETI